MLDVQLMRKRLKARLPKFDSLFLSVGGIFWEMGI